MSGLNWSTRRHRFFLRRLLEEDSEGLLELEESLFRLPFCWGFLFLLLPALLDPLELRPRDELEPLPFFFLDLASERFVGFFFRRPSDEPDSESDAGFDFAGGRLPSRFSS
mmetsp:Transcript_25677/g.34735  ORF Transcript_25677/g.34735 Transcript_25677/m.34735 type:complete len:111 (+) Transcript_25677:121-453(+)